MSDNVVVPNAILGEIQNDRQDELVKSFIELEHSAVGDSDRMKKMELIEEDRDLSRSIHDEMASDKSLKRFKDTFAIQMKRRHNEDGALNIPKPFAKSRASEELLGYFAEALIENEYDWGNYHEAYRQAFNTALVDGISFIHIGIKDDIVKYQKRELAQVIFDPNCTDFNAEPGSDEAPEWCIMTFEYSYKKGLRVAKKLTGEDWEGRIAPGLPTVTDEEYANNTNKWKEAESRKSTNRMGFRFCYDITGDQFVVFAGSSATKLVESKVPFRPRNKVGKREPRIPLVSIEFSPEKFGPYPASLYTLTKDITKGYQDILDRAFLHFKKSMNPMIFLFTDAGASILEQMEIAEQNQHIGAPPVILAATSENTKMESVAPPNLVAQVKEYRTLAVVDLAARMGMNLEQQAQIRQTFSEFREKNIFENKAISAINETNKKAHAMIPNYTIDLIRFHSNGTLDIEIDVKVIGKDGAIDTVAIAFPKALVILQDWTGRFNVDTNIKIPVVASEKMATINEIINMISTDIVNPRIVDMGMVNLKLDLIWQKLRLRDLEEIITREKLNSMYESIIKVNTAAAGQGGGGGQGGGEVEGEAAEIPPEGTAELEKKTPTIA